MTALETSIGETGSRSVIFQASHALIDVAAIDRAVVPEFFRLVLKDLIENDQVRMPTDEEIDALSHKDRAPDLDCVLNSLLYKQKSPFSLTDKEDADPESAERFKRTAADFRRTWLGELNSGKHIPPGVVEAIEQVARKGFRILVINDIPEALPSAYETLTDAIPSLDPNKDFAHTYLRGIEGKAPSELFSWAHGRRLRLAFGETRPPLRDADCFVFTNNTGLLVHAFQAGAGVSTCGWLRRQQSPREQFLPRSVPTQDFFHASTPQSIPNVVDRGLCEGKLFKTPIFLPAPNLQGQS